MNLNLFKGTRPIKSMLTEKFEGNPRNLSQRVGRICHEISIGKMQQNTLYMNTHDYSLFFLRTGHDKIMHKELYARRKGFLNSPFGGISL